MLFELGGELLHVNRESVGTMKLFGGELERETETLIEVECVSAGECPGFLEDLFQLAKPLFDSLRKLRLFSFDSREDAFAIGDDFVCREANDASSFIFHVSGPPRIRLGLISVMIAVDFYDELP